MTVCKFTLAIATMYTGVEAYLQMLYFANSIGIFLLIALIAFFAGSK